ncbi:MAG: BrnT family toxin [Terriglobia bacterium]
MSSGRDRHDSKHSQREARHYALGRTDENRLLFVAFTVRRTLIRVISAREMTRRERRFYEAYDEQEGPEGPPGV